MNAVYLILAGTLLGPIEGHTTYQQAPGPCSAQLCIDADGNLVSDRGLYNVHGVSEPIQAICERAMKEIGAERVATEHVLPPRAGYFAVPLMAWQIDGQNVLCIPAPSGLKP